MSLNPTMIAQAAVAPRPIASSDALQLHGVSRVFGALRAVDNVTFELSPDGTTLEVLFDYDGMETGQEWLYRTYVNDVQKNEFSTDPEPWAFQVPSGGLVLTFTEPAGFTSGDVMRTEVFVEGNLLGAGEFEIP